MYIHGCMSHNTIIIGINFEKMLTLNAHVLSPFCEEADIHEDHVHVLIALHRHNISVK